MSVIHSSKVSVQQNNKKKRRIHTILRGIRDW